MVGRPAFFTWTVMLSYWHTHGHLKGVWVCSRRLQLGWSLRLLICDRLQLCPVLGTLSVVWPRYVFSFQKCRSETSYTCAVLAKTAKSRIWSLGAICGSFGKRTMAQIQVVVSVGSWVQTLSLHAAARHFLKGFWLTNNSRLSLRFRKARMDSAVSWNPK